MAAEASGSSRPASVRAWDLPTRLFKWALVVLVVMAWATQRAGGAWLPVHIWNGYAILTLLVFRLFWGVFGSSTSRFSAWVTWPWTALKYGFDLVRGRGRRFLGHNPLGGWMIIALLVIVGSQALAGLFTVDENGVYGGPFSNLDFGDPTPIQSTLSRYHHRAFAIILVLATIHVVVNLVYQFVKSDPVIGAMITGRKPAEPFADEAEMRPARATGLRAVLCLAAALVAVLGTIRVAAGHLP